LFIVVPGALRTDNELGASFVNFFKILSGNIFIRGILCRDYTKTITHLDFWNSGYLPVMIGLLGIAILGYVIWKAEIEMKLLILFTFLIFFGALYSPQASLTMPQWEYLSGGSGGRYYFLPKLAWMISLGWLFFNSKLKFLTAFASVSLFCFVFLGLSHDWAFDKFHNYHFNKQVAEFKNMNIGETYKFKIVPGWEMSLTKK
jgi:hypothetical protein